VAASDFPEVVIHTGNSIENNRKVISTAETLQHPRTGGSVHQRFLGAVGEGRK
jgi:hypothetical protein